MRVDCNSICILLPQYIVLFLKMADIARSNRSITLDSLLNKERDRQVGITQYDGPEIQPEGNDVIAGDIWNSLLQLDKLEASTNLSEATWTEIFQLAMPFVADARRRGPRPASSTMDQLLCYTTWLKLGSDFGVLARILDLKESRMEDNVNRGRKILNQQLRARWWNERIRPKPLADTPFPHAALLIDGHTTQCQRPKAPFEEAKIYWDAHNHIYGIKNEVAVTASAPHYCMFVSKHYVGSVHDYVVHKTEYPAYLEYLQKDEDEALQLPTDINHRFWAVLVDSGYTGQAKDTPDVRRIFPFKGHVNALQEEFNHVQK
jgi:hypothetical protein